MCPCLLDTLGRTYSLGLVLDRTPVSLAPPHAPWIAQSRELSVCVCVCVCVCVGPGVRGIVGGCVNSQCFASQFVHVSLFRSEFFACFSLYPCLSHLSL